MIHIKRTGETPPLFKVKKIQLAQTKLINDFGSKISQEKLVFDFEIFKNQQLYSRLEREFGHKCAYCEREIKNGKGIFEHFRPSGGSLDFDNQFFPENYFWLAYEWSNLYFSCAECNTIKSNWFPVEGSRAIFKGDVELAKDEIKNEINLIIDPCKENPENDFKYLENGEIHSDTRKGKVTIELLKLNRTELIKERKTSLEDFRPILNLLKTSRKNNKPLLITATNNIENLLSDKPDGDFIGIKRFFLKEWLKENKNIWTKIKDIKTPNIDKLEGVELNTQTKSTKKALEKTDKQLSRLKRIEIEKIKIVNFKSISELVFEFNQQQNDATLLATKQIDSVMPWLLILGDNGVGKSSILQAVALTLIGQKQIDKIGTKGSEILKHGTKSGFVEVYQKGTSEVIKLEFTKKSLKSSSIEPFTFVLGFGSTRLLPKGRYFRPERLPSPYVKVKNLFDYTTSLIDANKWLIELKQPDFDRVSLALKDLLMLNSKDALTRKSNKIYINRNGDICTLDEMSDGYKSVVALTVDIMSTLSKNQAYFDIIEGVVLIDEIGNHLHPRWKMQIVKCLKVAFKSMQFIVTTHEPLCLQGLKYGEVVVLYRNSEHKVILLDSKVLPDHTYLHVDQLLTSDFFGLLNTLNAEVEKNYQRYYFLLSKRDRTPTEEIEVEELRHKINKAEQIGKTEREDTLLKAYDEAVAENLNSQNTKPKEQIKLEIKEDLKVFIKNNLDWQ